MRTRLVLVDDEQVGADRQEIAPARPHVPGFSRDQFGAAHWATVEAALQSAASGLAVRCLRAVYIPSEGRPVWLVRSAGADNVRAVNATAEVARKPRGRSVGARDRGRLAHDLLEPYLGSAVTAAGVRLGGEANHVRAAAQRVADRLANGTRAFTMHDARFG